MNLPSLKLKIRRGEIDTVIVAVPDVFGRLVGKRVTGQFFLDCVAEHGTHGCNYLLTVDIEMEPMSGFKLANWEKGFGDFALRPDLSTLRVLPWLPATALVLCDFRQPNGKPVEEAPRAVLQRQVDSLSQKRLICNIASELEFFLFNTSYHDAFVADYRNLTPSSDYRIDYQTMQPARDEALFRSLRNSMAAARVPVESSKGEWGRGQHEINFTYAQPVPMADMHTLFKQGAREIAAQHDQAITFMAKPSVTEPGNSCHIHASLWQGGKNLFWDAGKDHPVGGQHHEDTPSVVPGWRSRPKRLHEPADLPDRSHPARRSLGDAVVDFYAHTARLEVRAFDNAVTDWERHRYFERI